jgi:hypothetical protein
VEVAHADLSEVTGMVSNVRQDVRSSCSGAAVLVEICPVVVEATGHTATTGMLPVLADATVAGRDVAAVLPRF